MVMKTKNPRLKRKIRIRKKIFGTASKPRLAVTHQYCEAFMRQQENYLLELDKNIVRSLSPELRSLVGYSIYPPFMGMVDGKHPLRLLNE